MSAFVLEDGVVYHAYSTYARGVDPFWGMYTGSIALPRGATKPASGGAATTNTAMADVSMSPGPKRIRSPPAARPIR